MEIITYTLAPDAKEEYLQRIGTALQTRLEILFAYAHGTFLENGPFRDLDIALFIEPDQMPIRRLVYETDLERELGCIVEAVFPVDVRILNDAPRAFQFNALRGRLLFDSDPDARVDYLTWVAMRYLDIDPIIRHHTKEAFHHAIEP